MNESHGKITEIIDKKLGDNYSLKSITNVAKLAIRCVQDQPSSRPSITEVVGELREAAKHDNMVSEDIGTKSLHWEADHTNFSVESSVPIGMGWSDQSTTVLKVGR